MKVYEYAMTHLCKNLADIEELKCTYGCNKSYGFLTVRRASKQLKRCGMKKPIKERKICTRLM